MKEKSNKFLTIVFGIIAISLLGYVYWEKLTSKKSETGRNEKCVETKASTCKDVAGLYSGTIKNDNTKEEIKHFIYLMENAMFSYVLKGDDETVVYVGNYLINNNVITLNYWFDFDENLESINVINNEEKVTINSDGTISLESKYKLKALSGEDKKSELSNKVYDVASILNQVASNVRQ